MQPQIGFGRGGQERTGYVVPMTRDSMVKIIRATKPGDKLKIVFTNKHFHDLDQRLQVIMLMHHSMIEFGYMSAMQIANIALTGKWNDHRTYTIKALPMFNADYFINLMLGMNMLISIGKVENE